MTTNSLTKDANEVAELRALYEMAKVKMEELKEMYDRAHMALYARMEEEDVGSIKVGNINFVRAKTVYGQVQDLSAFVEWAEENAPELLERKARAAQLNEIVRERVEEGQALPDGIGFYVKTYVGQRAA